MIKIIIVSLLILMSVSSCKKNRPYDDYHETVKQVLMSYNSYNDLLIGRLKVYIKMDENQQYSYREVSHFCTAYFESEETNFSAKIAKHGLFAAGMKKNEKSSVLKRISCLIQGQEIKFLDFDLAITELKVDRVNYFGDLSIFISNKSKPRKTLTTCNSRQSCHDVAIIYPAKITKIHNPNKTYQDISQIFTIRLPINQISSVKLSQKNPEVPKIVEEKNNLPF